MPDTMVDTVETIDAQGNVGATFTGHVVATGLDLTAADGNVQDVNRISWLRAADGALVANIAANELVGDDVPGGNHSSFLTLNAGGVGTDRIGQVALEAESDFDPNFGSELFLYSAGPTNGATPRRAVLINQDDDSGNGQSYRIIGSDGSTSYVRKLVDVTLGAAAASIDIANIAQGCAHLEIVCALRGDTAAGTTQMRIQFNGDAGANYDWAFIRQNGAAVSANEFFGQTFGYLGEVPAATATANNYCAAKLTIANYAAAAFNKSLVGHNHAKQGAAAGQLWTHTIGVDWRTGNPITRITLFPGAGNWTAGSRLTLYGLGAA